MPVCSENLLKIFLGEFNWVIFDIKSILLKLFFLFEFLQLFFCRSFVLALLKLDIEHYVFMNALLVRIIANNFLVHRFLSGRSISETLRFVLRIRIKIANESILSEIISGKFY